VSLVKRHYCVEHEYDEGLSSDGVKARSPKAKAVVHKAKAKDKVINRDQGLRQGHDEPTQYHFL